MSAKPGNVRVAGTLLLLASLAAMRVASAAAATTWEFTAHLDDRHIGMHRFTLQSSAGDAQRLASDARFEVKILGIPVYRYRHQNEELWNGGCLASLNSTTDDHGDTTVVNGSASADGFQVLARTGRRTADASATGCVVSFAYWNPTRLAAQKRLLDPGTGRFETVVVSTLPASRIKVRGASTTVTGLRIEGLKTPIDLWYADGHWVGLDTEVDGRRLSYRLM